MDENVKNLNRILHEAIRDWILIERSCRAKIAEGRGAPELAEAIRDQSLLKRYVYFKQLPNPSNGNSGADQLGGHRTPYHRA